MLRQGPISPKIGLSHKNSDSECHRTVETSGRLWQENLSTHEGTQGPACNKVLRQPEHCLWWSRGTERKGDGREGPGLGLGKRVTWALTHREGRLRMTQNPQGPLIREKGEEDAGQTWVSGTEGISHTHVHISINSRIFQPSITHPPSSSLVHGLSPCLLSAPWLFLPLFLSHAPMSAPAWPIPSPTPGWCPALCFPLLPFMLLPPPRTPKVMTLVAESQT